MSEQPIFYPVMNEEYAVQITKEWNVPAYGAGFVMKFEVDTNYLKNFGIENVGGAIHNELWVPAEELEVFNARVSGFIEVTHWFYEGISFREARLEDIDALHFIRNAVKENALSNPALISSKDYEEFLTERGKGWLCETENNIAGFAIVDLKEKNVWALFVHPDFEQRGIGKQLHTILLDWYFTQSKETLWLSTAPGTRAEIFYRKNGWKETGTYGKGEIRFEMNFSEK